MDLISLSDIQDSSDGFIRLELLVPWMKSILIQLDQMHSYGKSFDYLHPKNILVSGTGETQLRMTNCTRASYYSPETLLKLEQGQTDNVFTCENDMWAFGLVFLNLFLGYDEIGGQDFNDVLAHIFDRIGDPNKSDLYYIPQSRFNTLPFSTQASRYPSQLIFNARTQREKQELKKGVLSRVSPRLVDPLCDFLKKTLQYHPQRRATARECLSLDLFNATNRTSQYSSPSAKYASTASPVDRYPTQSRVRPEEPYRERTGPSSHKTTRFITPTSVRTNGSQRSAIDTPMTASSRATIHPPQYSTYPSHPTPLVPGKQRQTLLHQDQPVMTSSPFGSFPQPSPLHNYRQVEPSESAPPQFTHVEPELNATHNSFDNENGDALFEPASGLYNSYQPQPTISTLSPLPHHSQPLNNNRNGRPQFPVSPRRSESPPRSTSPERFSNVPSSFSPRISRSPRRYRSEQDRPSQPSSFAQTRQNDRSPQSRFPPTPTPTQPVSFSSPQTTRPVPLPSPSAFPLHSTTPNDSVRMPRTALGVSVGFSPPRTSPTPLARSFIRASSPSRMVSATRHVSPARGGRRREEEWGTSEDGWNEERNDQDRNWGSTNMMRKQDQQQRSLPQNVKQEYGFDQKQDGSVWSVVDSFVEEIEEEMEEIVGDFEFPEQEPWQQRRHENNRQNHQPPSARQAIRPFGESGGHGESSQWSGVQPLSPHIRRRTRKRITSHLTPTTSQPTPTQPQAPFGAGGVGMGGPNDTSRLEERKMGRNRGREREEEVDEGKRKEMTMGGEQTQPQSTQLRKTPTATRTPIRPANPSSPPQVPSNLSSSSPPTSSLHSSHQTNIASATPIRSPQPTQTAHLKTSPSIVPQGVLTKPDRLEGRPRKIRDDELSVSAQPVGFRP